MTAIAFAGALEIGLIFALVALGVFISFRVINFPDLTVDGSFPLGGAVVATALVTGWHPMLATLAAFVAGALSGLVTGWLHVKLKIMQLLAGILMMIALYSINLRVMGKPNEPLLNTPTIFQLLPLDFIPEPWGTAVVLLILTLLIKFALDWYFASESGLAMRATGGNARMTRAVGVSTDRLSLAALALSNGIVAVAGALFAQSQGGADVSMGIGTIVIGLAAVIIGETILPGRTIAIATLGCIVGAVLYRMLIALGLNSDFIGLQAQDLNLVTAVLVAVALVLPASRRYLVRRFTRAGGVRKGASTC